MEKNGPESQVLHMAPVFKELLHGGGGGGAGVVSGVKLLNTCVTSFMD